MVLWLDINFEQPLFITILIGIITDYIVRYSIFVLIIRI